MTTGVQLTPLLPPEYSPIVELDTLIDYWSVLRAIIARLKRVGAGPPPRSRLHQAMQAIESQTALLGPAPESDEAARSAKEAYRTALEFWTIIRTLSPALASRRPVRKLLSRAYAGQLDPASTDQTSERARDAQFELWLGSWFAMGGRPTQVTEPDLRVALWFEWYSVAAKRVRSRAQLLARVEKAAAQIKASGRIGLIAISLDNYSDRSVAQATGVGPGNEFFGSFPELDSAESWLLGNAPWVKGTLSFGLITAWGPKVGALPSIDMSALERVILLNSTKEGENHLSEVLKEARVTRAGRWEDLQSHFALPNPQHLVTAN